MKDIYFFISIYIFFCNSISINLFFNASSFFCLLKVKFSQGVDKFSVVSGAILHLKVSSWCLAL